MIGQNLSNERPSKLSKNHMGKPVTPIASIKKPSRELLIEAIIVEKIRTKSTRSAEFLVADHSGSILFSISASALIDLLNEGDIIRLSSCNVILNNNSLKLFATVDSVRRIGQISMLFRREPNISAILQNSKS